MSNFNGVGVTINGRDFDGNYISPNSWTVKRERKLIRAWTDVLGNIHEDYYPPKKATISFTIRAHTETEHATIISFFEDVTSVSVTFYDDSTDSYIATTCKITAPEWRQYVTRVGSIIYGDTSVTLEEL